jgi:hypothetical protein
MGVWEQLMGYETVLCMVRTFLHQKTITVIMASHKRKMSCRKSFGKLNVFLFASKFLL